MELNFEGKSPTVAASAWVASASTLIGDVVLDDDVSVWFGAVLRADGDRIWIGAGSNVQDCSIMHADPGRPVRVAAGVTVGHRAVLHGCTVEENVLIGIGSIVLNDAVIGAGSVIGAGAVVAEGSVVPPGSLVLGVPGRVKRSITPDDTDRIRRNASAYIELARRYAANG